MKHPFSYSLMNIHTKLDVLNKVRFNFNDYKIKYLVKGQLTIRSGLLF